MRLAVRAVICREFGPIEALEVAELPPPEPGPGQVVVSVRAAGVNYPDALLVQGRYQEKPALPFTPGGELAGVVKSIGPARNGDPPFEVGQAVYGGLLRGCFAEEVAVDAAKLRAIPAGCSFEQAACVSTTYHTSYYALVTLAAIRPGESVLVLGAAGGVGLAAIEIAKAFGARVIAAASSDEKLAVCRSHGADELIQYARSDLRARLKELTDGQGVDVVYDPVGGEYSEAALRGLAWRGRHLVVGFTAGIPKIPTNLVLLKGAALLGVMLGAAFTRDASVAKKVIDSVAALLEAGSIRPQVSERYEFSRTAEALKRLLERRVAGKLVLIP